MRQPNAPKKIKCPACGTLMTAVLSYAAHSNEQTGERYRYGGFLRVARIARTETETTYTKSIDDRTDAEVQARVCPVCGHIEFSVDNPGLFVSETPTQETHIEAPSIIGRLKGEKTRKIPIGYYAVTIKYAGNVIDFCARGVSTPSAKDLVDGLDLPPEQALAARVTTRKITPEEAARDYDLTAANDWPIYGTENINLNTERK